MKSLPLVGLLPLLLLTACASFLRWVDTPPAAQCVDGSRAPECGCETKDIDGWRVVTCPGDYYPDALHGEVDEPAVRGGAAGPCGLGGAAAAGAALDTCSVKVTMLPIVVESVVSVEHRAYGYED